MNDLRELPIVQPDAGEGVNIVERVIAGFGAVSLDETVAILEMTEFLSFSTTGGTVHLTFPGQSLR